MLCLQRPTQCDTDSVSESRLPSWCVCNVVEVQCFAVHSTTCRCEYLMSQQLDLWMDGWMDTKLEVAPQSRDQNLLSLM